MHATEKLIDLFKALLKIVAVLVVVWAGIVFYVQFGPYYLVFDGELRQGRTFAIDVIPKLEEFRQQRGQYPCQIGDVSENILLPSNVKYAATQDGSYYLYLYNPNQSGDGMLWNNGRWSWCGASCPSSWFAERCYGQKGYPRLPAR